MAKKKGSSSSSNSNNRKSSIANSKSNSNAQQVGKQKRSNRPSPSPLITIPAVMVGIVVAVIAAYYARSTSTDETAAASRQQEQCGLYIAKSSLPNAGLGMFAGRSYQKTDVLGLDHIVPIFDLATYQGSGWPFLWNSYTWNADGIIGQEAHTVDITNHGFGSLANSYMDLWNAEMHETEKEESTSSHGDTSPYHQRVTAREDVQQGQELFVNYGREWFLKRTWWMGIFPLEGDVPRADALLQKWNGLRERHGLSMPAFRELWESTVMKNPFAAKSRILTALPQNWTKIEDALERKSLKQHLQHETIRSVEWLEENGMCADHMRQGPSPISGRGSFATRFLPEGKAIATMPLIHVPFRSRFEMGSPRRHQLLLNYCFGHRQSTILLCPYGPGTSFINHDHSNPNVKIVWGNPQTSSSHDPQMLKTPLDVMYQTKQSSALAFEVVTLRPIVPGQEILLDYGKEWEDAWERHVRTVGPIPKSGRKGPYTSDLHSPNAFRHDVRIPDAIFPEAWKNVR